ncbi:MAG: hypothetical protein ABIO38_06985 [Luteimonas sp.]
MSWTLPVPAASIYSVYTDLTDCRTVQVFQESGASIKRCPGVAGHHLLVEDDDDRQSVTIVAPDGKRQQLRYWDVITGAFSSLGEKAEWRVTGTGKAMRPIALIVRVHAHENPDAPSERTSYLAVAKVAAGKICVTHRVENSRRANEEARRVADASAGAACLD